jgi:hypothetical protein
MNTNVNRRNILLAGTTLAAASAFGTSAVAAVPTESPTRWKAGDDIDAIRDHWLLTIFALGILAAIAWFMPAAIRSIVNTLPGDGPPISHQRRGRSRNCVQRAMAVTPPKSISPC